MSLIQKRLTLGVSLLQVRTNILALVLALICLASCSKGDLTDTSDLSVELILASVTSHYLDAIVEGRSEQLEGMILWAEYLTHKNHAGKNYIMQQVVLTKGQIKRELHPLIDLHIQKIDVQENSAHVTMRQHGKESNPLVTIDYAWTGNGWLITNDNILGQSGILCNTLCPVL